MNWDQEAIEAAKSALATVNEAIDAITAKATHLESLLTVLAYTSALDEMPAHQRENACWLGVELAAEIRAAAIRLG
jgi:hypothetical protein